MDRAEWSHPNIGKHDGDGIFQNFWLPRWYFKARLDCDGSFQLLDEVDGTEQIY